MAGVIEGVMIHPTDQSVAVLPVIYLTDETAALVMVSSYICQNTSLFTDLLGVYLKWQGLRRSSLETHALALSL